MVERFKKRYSLKMYIIMKYQFILHDKNLVCVTKNQPSLPMFQVVLHTNRQYTRAGIDTSPPSPSVL